ncbi:MAG: serine/threonine protein kinase [Xanthomonadales bacterium PRO7]|nr:serine/threonine protein kinase [Xanthomonadales bacterium PRO7]
MTAPDPPTDSTTQNALREAFDALLELPPETRADWLETHIADASLRERLRDLLAAHDSHGFLDTAAGEHAARLAARDLAPEGLIGSRIGAFRLVRALGQGGMSAVFLGEREDADFRQQAAIKLLRRGLYSELEQRLFQRERRVLAALEHPHIARLIDGGVTAAGIPYLVMEYVDGVPITRYADTRGLDVRARVRLFVDVCRAVAEAHRNLIVHRDIKPSNILVAADGTVKLLDFGIAKLIEEDNTDSTGTVGVFTPDYAAPEQLRGGAITTATDVYGLGVLLHELLLGLRPGGTPTRRPSSRVNETVSGNVPSIERARLRKLLRGDLDNILLKALAEEPQRRYASAGALADDIDNFLSGRAVAAHPPSRAYRARKFVQRHRGGVAVTALFLLGILTALGVALWQANVARQQAQRANTTRDFLLSVFDAASAHLPRNQRPTPDALVAAAQQRLSTADDLDASTRADFSRTLGKVELSLANFTRAQTLFASAEKLAADPAQARSDRILHAQALQRAGDNAAAIAAINAELTSLRAQPAPMLVRALDTLAAAEAATGATDSALAHQREAATTATRVFGKDSSDAIAAVFEIGNTLAELQRYPEAIATLTPMLTRWRAQHAQQDDRYVAALGSLATAQDGVGDLPAAEARFRELLALKQRIYTAPHDAIAATLRDLAQIVARAERFPEAENLIGQALAMDRQVFGGDDHLEVAEDFDARGGIFVAQRRFSEADADYQKAIDICTTAQIKNEVCTRARNNLGMSLYRQDRLDEAKQQMTLALAERRALFGSDHPTVAYSLSTLANVAVKQHDYKTAVDDSAQALAVLDRDGGSASREDALIRFGYAQALWMTNRNADALHEIERTLADWQRLEPDAKARRVAMLVQKAQILNDLKRTDEARRAALDAIAIGAPASELAPQTRQLLRELSGRSDVYPDSPSH